MDDHERREIIYKDISEACLTHDVEWLHRLYEELAKMSQDNR